MKTLLPLFCLLLAALSVATTSCIEDGYDMSPSAQPVFSTDTLSLGEVFTGQPTPTSRFTIRNPHSKIITLSHVALRSGKRTFRLNVDGQAGETFSGVDIRPGDSIYVFVEATLPEGGRPELSTVEDHLDITTNGVTGTVVIKALGRDVKRLRGLLVDSDTRLTAEYPYQVFDSLVVLPGATLTLEPGTTLHFHDKAYLRVEGTLLSRGETDRPVTMRGDRTGNVVADITFDIMASQWDGVHFAPESRGNRLTHTEVRNTVAGVIADSLSQVDFHNCRLRNSAGWALVSRYADLKLTGTEVAEAASGAVALMGGTFTANHCTFANYYLFSAIQGAIIQFYHFSPDHDNQSEMPYLQADISNSIIYGLGTDLSAGDLSGTDITIRQCLLKSSGSDDNEFISCLWDTDPLYRTVREDYLFDYRLLPESPAWDAADPTLTLPEAALDPYGTPRLPSPALGAYQTPAPTEEI